MKKPILAIVSGAIGSLGNAYLKKLLEKKNIKCIGICRKRSGKILKKVEYVFVDLLNAKKTGEKINALTFQDYSEIILIHPVGKFKFKENEAGIDQDVFSSNFNTFFNLVSPLIKSVDRSKKKTKITLMAFGSVSDKYNIPFWKSYTKAKNKLRKFMKGLSGRSNGKIKCLFVNISSAETKKENELRPFADKKYWLKPEKIVSRSLKILFGNNFDWMEIDVFEPILGFRDSYYKNHKKILAKWKKEMGK